METLERLRHRIATANELEAVVRTMKGLAAVSIRAFETAAQAVGHYMHTVELGLQILLTRNPELALPRGSQTRRAQTTGMLVFGSEQGLCGSFNRLVADHAHRELQQLPAFRLGAAGVRVIECMKNDHKHEDVERIRMPVSVEGITERVTDALLLVTRWLEHGHVTRILLVHNRLSSAASYTPTTTTLFPFDHEWIAELRARRWNSPSRCLPASLAPTPALLKRLIRHHLFIGLYRAFAESLAAEHAARLAAMQAAERNIEERLAALQLAFHQLRQAAITEELLDVVSGFEALNAPPVRQEPPDSGQHSHSSPDPQRLG